MIYGIKYRFWKQIFIRIFTRNLITLLMSLRCDIMLNDFIENVENNF